MIQRMARSQRARSSAGTSRRSRAPAVAAVVRKALGNPRGIAPALIQRVNPRHGPSYVIRSDGFVTFTVDGFVAAPSPPMLLARHNFETSHIRRQLADMRVNRSLEIGCGFGRLSPVFAEFSADHVAVDINAEALADAKATYPQINFREASVTALPFPDDHFGLVTTWTVLQHIPPEQADGATAEIKRVLAPEGTLLLCEETRYPGAGAEHTWHRELGFYEQAFAPLKLAWDSSIEEIDRLPGMESPGRVMLFRSGDRR